MGYKKHQLKDVTISQLNHVIDEYIIGFKAERNRSIMRDRLCAGYTYEELAEMYDMSVNQMKNIVYKELEILAKHLEVGID